MNKMDARLMDRLTQERDAARAEVARLTPKAEAWDELMALMGKGGIAIHDMPTLRRAFWTAGPDVWITIAAQWGGPAFDVELYRGDDPLAALAALTADDKINAP